MDIDIIGFGYQFLTGAVPFGKLYTTHLHLLANDA